MKYTRGKLTDILNKHGYTPRNVDNGWLTFATHLATLDRLDTIIRKKEIKELVDEIDKVH